MVRTRILIIVAAFVAIMTHNLVATNPLPSTNWLIVAPFVLVFALTFVPNYLARRHPAAVDSE